MDRRLTTQAGLLTTSRALGQLLNALVAFVLVRKLTQVDYGTFRQVYLLSITLYATELGLVESLYFFVPRFPERRAIFLRQTVAIIGTLQIVAGGLMVAFRQSFARFFENPQLASYMALVAVYAGLTVVTRMWEVELVAEKRISFAALVGLGFETLKVVLMFVALAVSAGIRSLLWALAAAAVLKFAGFMLFLGREFRWFVDAGSLRAGAPQFGYAMALWIPGLLNGGIALQSPQYIVAHYFDPAQYAIYAVACFQLPFVGILSNSIAEVMLVRATEYYSQGSLVDLYDLWIGGCKKALLLYIGVIGVVVAFAKPIITVLFTSRYDASVQLFAIMSLGLVFNAIFQDCIFRACSAMKTYAFFYLLRATLSVVLAIVGLKLWGLWGVAVSTVVAPAIVNLLQLLPIGGLLKVSLGRVLPWLDIGKMLLAASLAALVARLTLHDLVSPLAELITGLTLYGIVYAALVIKLRLVSGADISGLLREIRGRFGRASAIRPDANPVS